MQILLISYDFPPVLAGVRRVIKFAKFLPEFGFEPVVLAAEPAANAILDAEALTEVERGGYPVHRTRSLDVYHLSGRNRSPSTTAPPAAASPPSASSLARNIARAFSPWIFVPDDRVGWLPYAIPAAKRLIAKHNIQFILTTSYPNSTHLVGLALKRQFPHLKWIADFRDGWVQNPYFSNYPTPLHKRINVRLEGRVARAANALTTVSEPIAAHLRTVSGSPAKVHVIPNGFDPDDLAGVTPMRFDPFTIAYTGTLFMQRSPELFFRAVRELLDENPALAGEFQIVFMTQFKPEHLASIDRYRLHETVKNLGMAPHKQALALQAGADALLVMEGEAPNSEIMLTQKIFEYLAARKPVLAIAPPGALAGLVRQSGAGEVVPPGDLEQIKLALQRTISRQLHFAPRDEVINRFYRRTQAQALAHIAKAL